MLSLIATLGPRTNFVNDLIDRVSARPRHGWVTHANIFIFIFNSSRDIALLGHLPLLDISIIYTKIKYNTYRYFHTTYEISKLSHILQWQFKLFQQFKLFLS